MWNLEKGKSKLCLSDELVSSSRREMKTRNKELKAFHRSVYYHERKGFITTAIRSENTATETLLLPQEVQKELVRYFPWALSLK